MKKQNYITKNKKAFFDYEIIQSWEAGIELKGHEVKSIRQWQINLKGSYLSFISWELFLKAVHITPWKALPNTTHVDAARERKVFLKKRTLLYLSWKSKEWGNSIIPLEVYLQGSLIKIRIALAKWKKKYQKKESLKKKSMEKDIRRAMSKSY